MQNSFFFRRTFAIVFNEPIQNDTTYYLLIMSKMKLACDQASLSFSRREGTPDTIT